jgi:hypothetical protein
MLQRGGNSNAALIQKLLEALHANVVVLVTSAMKVHCGAEESNLRIMFARGS